MSISLRLSAKEHFILVSTMSSLNISISLRRKLMLMLTLRQSSLAHKLLILNMFMFYACVASKDRALGLGTGEIDWL